MSERLIFFRHFLKHLSLKFCPHTISEPTKLHFKWLLVDSFLIPISPNNHILGSVVGCVITKPENFNIQQNVETETFNTYIKSNDLKCMTTLASIFVTSMVSLFSSPFPTVSLLSSSLMFSFTFILFKWQFSLIIVTEFSLQSLIVTFTELLRCFAHCNPMIPEEKQNLRTLR